MKKLKSKARRKVKDSGQGYFEKFYEDEQLLEYLKERFEESERRIKADNNKRQSYIEETRERKVQDEHDTGDKNKVEGVVQK